MTNWQKELEDFYQILRTEGYRRKDALAECEAKEGRKKDVDKVVEDIDLRYTVPLSVLDGYGGYGGMSLKKRDHYLWMLGMDTKNHIYTTDLGYFTAGGERQWGWFVFGNERVDKHWTTMYIEGVRVASWEAQLAGSNDHTLKSHLRGMSLERGDSLSKIGM